MGVSHTYLNKPDPHTVAIVGDAAVVVLVAGDDDVGRREQLRWPLAQHRHGSWDLFRRHAPGNYAPLSRILAFSLLW